MKTKFYNTNYAVAVNWCNNNYILQNNICEIDPSVFDNMRFNIEDEETGEYHEIFQWFITDASDADVEYLEKEFNLKFSYSDLLDHYVLCVDHYGTAWDYVYWTTTNEHAAAELGQKVK